MSASKLETLLQVAGISGKLVTFSLNIAGQVIDIVKDGNPTPDEVAALGRKIGEKLGADAEIKVEGHDVFHGPAGGDLGSFIARVTYQVIIAKRAA